MLMEEVFISYIVSCGEIMYKEYLACNTACLVFLFFTSNVNLTLI